jgi:hypothetical protein
MDIYSGEVNLGETGIESNHKDVAGNRLYTGDIVIIYTKDYIADGLTVIVHDKDGFWAMGIKDAMTTDEDGSWMVRRVKSHADAIHGEHWSNFGFSYREGQGHDPS